LQRELLVVTRAKAAREAELKNCIWKLMRETMVINEEIKKFKSGGKGVRGHVDSTSFSCVSTLQLQRVPAITNLPISSSDHAGSNPPLMVPLIS
jgi:hypothetical protein